MCDPPGVTDECWVVDLFPGGRRIPPRQHEEWLDRVFAILRDEHGCGGRDVRTEDGYRSYTPRGGSLTGELRVTVLGDRLIIRVAGGPETPRSGVKVWRRAGERAAAELGKNLQVLPWEAVIGPDWEDQQGEIRIAEPTTIGGFRLTPLPLFAEWRRPMDRLDIALPEARTWPLKVEATTEAVLGPRIRALAGRQLRRLCATLTVVIGFRYVVRVGPRFEGPNVTGFLATSLPDQEDRIAPHDRALPAWLEEGLRRMDGNSDLADAVDGFFDGTGLEREYPSQACIAYVAAIEAIGGLIAPGTSGFTKKFQGSLVDVLPSSEIKKVKSVAYEHRSSTAHGGTVHGLQRSLGLSGGPSFLGTDDDERFRDTLRILRKAARRLLWRQLGGPVGNWTDESEVPRGLVAAAESWVPISAE